MATEEKESRTMENMQIKATSIRGVCQMYGFGQATVERAIRKGDLPASRVGRRIVIRISDIEKWIGTARPRKSDGRRS
jgi:excisionase family DNA binding protein